MSHETEGAGIIQFFSRFSCAECRFLIVLVKAIGHDFTISHTANRFVQNTLRRAGIADVNPTMPELVTSQQIMPGCFILEQLVYFFYIRKLFTVCFSKWILKVY
ncbi:hypothetical protein DBV33_27755 [Pseudomonas fluorescens]|nr:hypothetical protein DBV33_27755 [Pseudomonas fluorescens]POA38062.1 hypothetical protein C1891_09645 [Pseudomonas sp. GW456-12-1-14-TSB6]